MNLDERLSEALHSTLDRRQIPPDLSGRIVDSIADGTRPRRAGVRLQLAGVAAVLLVVALVPLGLMLRPGGSAASTAEAETPIVSSAGLAHFDEGGIAFDYPAAWRALPSGVRLHYDDVIAYLGTDARLTSCPTVTPTVDQMILEGGVLCDISASVAPGQVLVTVDLSQGPPRPGPIDPADAAALPPGSSYVTVGGLPAILSERTVDGIVDMEWQLSVPKELIERYSITAYTREPGLDTVRRQMAAVIASIQYDPRVPVLSTTDGPRVAAAAVRELKDDPAYACFPTTIGATATARITRFPGSMDLLDPLEVTCSIQIVPSVVGLWKLTLTESWPAGNGHSAGSTDAIQWVNPDGSLGMWQGAAQPTDVSFATFAP